MKYIKTYEEEKNENCPKVGDYVSFHHWELVEPWNSYITNQIGQMIDRDGSIYLIKTYISDDIYVEVFKNTNQRKFIDEDEDGKYIIMRAKNYNIDIVGKTIDEVIIKKNAKNYNL